MVAVCLHLMTCSVMTRYVAYSPEYYDGIVSDNDAGVGGGY